MANPRKFSEKIALLNQKEAQDSAAFEAIMKEVSNVTSRVASASSSVGASPTGSGVPETPLSVKSAGASPPQSSGKHLHINLGNQFRAGGSLPNVNNNVNCGNDAKEHSSPHPGAIHSIDLKDLQDVIPSDSRAGSLESLTHPSDRVLRPHHPSAPAPRRSRSPSIRRHSPTMPRSPSPRRHSRYDHHGHYHDGPGFSDTVSNVVEIQRHTHHPHASQYNHRHRIRDYYDHCDYYDDGPWSASTSPARSPSPVHRIERGGHYGTTSLQQRSRSPSPIGGSRPHHHHHRHHPHQHSYPVLVARRGQGRRLPPTPNKPSTLQLKPANINFPKLNASPTHGPHGVAPSGPAHVPVGPVSGHILQHPHPPSHVPSSVQPSHHPLSFEQAVAMGRGGRMLPSPVPNGYKPQPQSKQRAPRSRHSDSDEDDWC